MLGVLEMTSVTLYGLKVAGWKTSDLGNKPCAPRLENERFIAMGVKHYDYGDYPYPDDHKRMLETYRDRHVRKTAEGIYRQHSSMIEIENGNDAHGYPRYQWELRICHHHEYYTGWDVVTYHEEEYEIPDGKVWYVYVDNDSYADGTEMVLHFSTFDKACELYHADPEDLEDDPFDFHRWHGIMTLGYIRIDDEAGEIVLTKYLRGRDEI